ncbi:MAG: AAA family ATPase [Promethearchaeota archaeon]
MILKSIKIENIRSISSGTIEFPPSTMLFFGDVGSGKSSVLKSIEFALFGTLLHGDLRGDSLLRRGRRNASVELEFFIDGKKYAIKRNLSRDKKGKVTQDECFFSDYDKGEKVTYAPTDMRRKILSLLSYSISRYEKANKLPLFRYTVYTPQEQLKEIIQADPNERFEILKEVFGIEKYETVLKNIETIKDFLNDKLKVLEIKLDQIGEPEEEIIQKEKEIQKIKDSINNIENEISLKEKGTISQEKVVDKIQEEFNSYSKKLVKVENYESNINEYKTKYTKVNLTLEKIRNEIVEKEIEIKNLKEIKRTFEFSEEQLDIQLEQLQNLKAQNEKELTLINKKLLDIDTLLKEGKCSLCGQSIHEKDRFEQEFNEASLDLKKLKTKINEITHKINDKKETLKDLREFQKNKNKKDSIKGIIEEKQKREKDLVSLVKEQFKKINEYQEEIFALLSEYRIKNLQKFKDLGKDIKGNLDFEKKKLSVLKEEKESISNELSAQKKGIEFLQKDLVKLKEDIQNKKLLKDNLIYYSQLKNWVSEQFPILIRDIEKKIISSSAHHFNTYFKEWFHELVEDKNIEVEIRPDDFQPIVYVNGYESPFRDLSGGEKSGLSLAYRLALNKIINERYQQVKTKDLLILDEPTDGFSQQQINRMQSVFEKLNTSQMIIISHERNLDSFVTDIFHFKKENHITKVNKES